MSITNPSQIIANYTNEYGVYIQAKSYSSMYPYYEMVGITFRETVVNLLTSALAVTVVLFLLLPPGPSVLAVLSVLLCDVAILAWVPFTGLNLNAISSTCMVMSVGIAVDFSAHVTHAFVETDGASLTGGQRAAKAVTKMGRSLTTSALTTFLSVLMLSTVTVPSNRMFFTMMTGVVIFGLLFGMMLLPTVLSFINPSYVKPLPIPDATPMTPLSPGEEAEQLERTRSRGVRRHHRRHHGKHDEVDKPTEEVDKPTPEVDKPTEEENKPTEEEEVRTPPIPGQEIELAPIYHVDHATAPEVTASQNVTEVDILPEVAAPAESASSAQPVVSEQGEVTPAEVAAETAIPEVPSESVAPEVTSTPTAQPEVTPVPDASEPAQSETQPEAVQPATVQSETAQSETQPEAVQPATVQSETAQPETQSKTAQSGTVAPEVVQPETPAQPETPSTHLEALSLDQAPVILPPPTPEPISSTPVTPTSGTNENGEVVTPSTNRAIKKFRRPRDIPPTTHM